MADGSTETKDLQKTVAGPVDLCNQTVQKGMLTVQ